MVGQVRGPFPRAVEPADCRQAFLSLNSDMFKDHVFGGQNLQLCNNGLPIAAFLTIAIAGASLPKGGCTDSRGRNRGRLPKRDDLV